MTFRHPARWAGLAILLAAAARPLPLHAFVFASEEASLVRSPFFQQQTLDSDIRLRGMGFLTLPIDDDSNRIGVFKYGGLFAGLPTDYRGQRKAELSYWNESGPAKDKTSGDKLFDASEQAWGGMGAFHFGTENSGEGAVAGGFQSVRSKLDIPDTAADDEPDLYNAQIGYGHRLGRWIFGLGYRMTDTNPFKQDTTPAHLNIKTHEVAPSVGYVFTPAADSELTVVAGPRFQKEKDDVIVFGHNTADLDGTAFDVGVNFDHGQTFHGGVYVTTGKIDGDRGGSSGKIGTEEDKQQSLHIRGYFRPTDSRLSYGGLLETNSDTTTNTNLSGATTTDDKVTDLAVGGGVALSLAENRGLIGTELRLLSGKDDDRLNSDAAKNSGYQFSLGGEYAVIPPVRLRAGTRYIAQTYTESGLSDQDTSQWEFTLGGDVRIGQHTTLALTYINGAIKTDEIRQNGILNSDKETFNTNSIQLLARVEFGGTER